MDLEEFRRKSLSNGQIQLINEAMEEELAQKIESIDTLISYQTDFVALKEEICDIFQKLKDDITNMISEYEIEIMSKISKIELSLEKNVYIQEIKRELHQLKTKNAKDITKRDQSYIRDLNDLDELSFVKKNLSKIIKKADIIKQTIYSNVEEITQKIKEKTKNILYELDFSQICKKDENLFEDLSKFKGQLFGEIMGDEEVYCISKLQEDYFLTTSKPNMLKLYSAKDNFLFKFRYNCTTQPRTIAQLSNNKVAIGSEEGNIHIFRFDKTNEILILTKIIQQKIMLWDICKINQDCLATVSFCGKIQFINFNNGKLIKQYMDDQSCYINVKNINKKYVSVSCSKVQIIDKVTFNVAYQYKNDEMGYIFALEKLDNKRIAFGGTDCKVRIWNFKTDTMEAVLLSHKQTIYQIKKLSQGYICSCSEDGKLIIWDISQSKQSIFTANSHTDSTYSIEVFPKYNMIITGGKENILKIWK